MTMYYSDDVGHGVCHLNDDVEPCTYKHQGKWTDRHKAIEKRLREYLGVSNLIKEDE